jgi:hypothetical protein
LFLSDVVNLYTHRCAPFFLKSGVQLSGGKDTFFNGYWLWVIGYWLLKGLGFRVGDW